MALLSQDFLTSFELWSPVLTKNSDINSALSGIFSKSSTTLSENCSLNSALECGRLMWDLPCSGLHNLANVWWSTTKHMNKSTKLVLYFILMNDFDWKINNSAGFIVSGSFVKHSVHIRSSIEDCQLINAINLTSRRNASHESDFFNFFSNFNDEK